MGIRNRFGIVLPAEYRRIQHLQYGLPYFKVGDDGAWQIYDIERHELVSKAVFSDILPYRDTDFILKSDEGDRYLNLPFHYDRLAQSQQAVITDDVPAVEQLSDNAVQGLVNSLIDKLSLSTSIETVVAVYNSESKPEATSSDDLSADSVKTEEPRRSDIPECARYIFYAWYDVLASIYTNPEKVYITEDICPDCGERLVEFCFSSPGWTWREMCGRAGYMTICPACPRQIDFELTRLN